MSWFAAILLPQFPLQAALRWREEAWSQPVAVVNGHTEKGQVLELTDAAAQSGVWRGMAATQALARSPTLQLLPRSPAQEQILGALLLETAGTFSPLLEATGEGLCLVDLRQMKPRDWTAWTAAVVERFAAVQLRACVGVAAHTDLAALAATRAEPALVVQHPGAFLAGLAIAEVDAPPELVAVLRDWGISHLGELARLPRSDLIERLGPAAGVLWERATGRARRELRLVRPPEIFDEAFDFEHPIETTEPLLFLLRRQLEQLVFRLGEAYRVAAQMTLTILLEPGPSHLAPSPDRYERVFTVPSPTGDTEVLFRILHTHLENLRLEQQPIGVRLRLEPALAERSQFQLFESPLRDPNRFGETLGRLAALVGAAHVGVVHLEDTHRPDRFQLAPPQFGRLSETTEPEPASNPALGLPLHRFRPPLSAQVHLQRHVPTYLFSENAHGEVIDAAGPYRVSGQWWDRQAWIVEEWDVELGDGGIYRLSKHQDAWFVEGCYDAPLR